MIALRYVPEFTEDDAPFTERMARMGFPAYCRWQAGWPDAWWAQADEHGRLFVGAAPRNERDWAELRELGVTHVLNVANEPLADNPFPLMTAYLTILRLPLVEDGRKPPDEWFEQGIRYAFEAISAGGIVYVHCMVGSARGPAMTYAILRRLDYGHRRAERIIRAARPRGSHFYLGDAKRWADRRFR